MIPLIVTQILIEDPKFVHEVAESESISSTTGAYALSITRSSSNPEHISIYFELTTFSVVLLLLLLYLFGAVVASCGSLPLQKESSRSAFPLIPAG